MDVKWWPQLKDCASVILKHLECSQKIYVYIVLHDLMDHFFSEHRSQFHSRDIDWFLDLASEKIEWKQQHIRILTDNSSDGIPFGVIKHYLLRVMTHEKNVDGRNTHFAGFNKQVSQMNMYLLDLQYLVLANLMLPPPTSCRINSSLALRVQNCM